MTVRILIGDVRAKLAELSDESVHCVVTSPPYFGLRDYGTASWDGGDPACQHSVGGQVQDNKAPGAIMSGMRPGADASRCRLCGAARQDKQIGLEPTPAEFVAVMVEVFREVRRVLRKDGTLWLNLGDSYATGTAGDRKPTQTGKHGYWENPAINKRIDGRDVGLKPKDLMGIPWSVAKALQAPYYTGRIAAERDRVWLAAIMDGEGTICGFDHDRADNGSHRSGIHIFMTNSSMALLDEAARIWPTSRSEHGRPGPGHLGDLPTWRWIVHGIANKQAVLREIYPHLIAKRQQAVVAYSMLLLMENAKRLGHSALKDETIAKRAVCTALLSDLNHQRPVVMPDWLTEPPTMFEPGFYLRQDIIWSKPNPMPESVTDRCTKAHEYLFLLSKSARYHYDAEAIAEAETMKPQQRLTSAFDNPNNKIHERPQYRQAEGSTGGGVRNRRSVWTVATQPFKEAHFATFPPDLIEPCIKAGCPKDCCAKCGAPVVRDTEKTFTPDAGGALQRAKGLDESNGWNGFPRGMTSTITTGWSPSCSCDAGVVRGTVLDPGAGTTALVADRLGRDAILIELNPEYAGIAERRIRADGPMFAKVEAA